MLPLVFSVRHSKPELVAPCKPTPREMKQLSHIDQQMFLRCQMPILLLYPAPGKQRSDDGKEGRVLKEALGKVLVYYHPWAGRMREVHGPNGEEKLVVDCTGEGVLFVEAEADVTLEELGGDDGFLRPPFPCSEDLLFDVPGSSDFLDSPLLFFQITRLKCGGFVLAVRFNHAMTDGFGFLQFLIAFAEIARGASQPSVMPVWSRHIISSSDLPLISTDDQLESEDLTVIPVDDGDNEAASNMNDIHRTFFFGLDELSIIRQRLQPYLRSAWTNFELLAAFLWRCRINALCLHSLQDVTLLLVVNVRPMLNLPTGYYGNAVVLATVFSQAGKITASLDHAVELVKRAKADVTPEFVRSVSPWPGSVPTHFQFTATNSWLISDNKPLEKQDLDFGWGKPVYGGSASDLMHDQLAPVSFFVKGMDDKGRSGLLVPISLPHAAMDRLAQLLDFSPTPKL